MKKIDKFYIYLFIIIQPIIDVIAYFTFSPKITIVSFVLRSLLLLLFVLISFFKIKDKKKLIITLTPLIIISFIHVLCGIVGNGISFGDIKNTFCIMQTPALTIIIIFLLRQNLEYKKQLERGLVTNLITIFSVIVLSIITDSYAITYFDYGILGWFSGSNTPSMILTLLCPLFLMQIMKRESYKIYFFACIVVIFLLFTNGTRACYFSMIALFILMSYLSIFMKKNNVKKYFVFISIFAFITSVLLYPFSSTNLRRLTIKENEINTQEQIENIEIQDQNLEDLKGELEAIDSTTNNSEANNSNISQEQPPQQATNISNFTKEDLEVYAKLKLSYIYVDLMKHQGTMPVIERMRDKISAENLADNRMVKRVNIDIEFDKGNIFTKLFGVNYSLVGDVGYDPENDITALFYYLGYIGFAIYCSYFIFIIVLGINKFFKEKNIIINPEIMVLAYTLALSVVGGEFSGAILRKPNANLYVAIIIGLIYLFCTTNETKKEKNPNKITFLNLHLGYGGIETSTINSANILSQKYDIEIVSFYNLEKNQSHLLNKKISVKYLYDGGPNKAAIINAIKTKNIVSCIKEGIKSLKIIILKHSLIIKSIQECDSKFIVSTRYEFSKLLSEFKTFDTIAIAQEHHHHNNNKKYIKVLSEEYTNIDYLFALNKGLEADYKVFLKNNKFTKVVVVPNMIIPSKSISELKNRNIISVGRLHPGKRIPEIVKMMPKLKNVDKFFIIGDGEDYDKLEELIKKMKLSKRVKLLGYKNREEIEEYYKESSVFVMTSETEGLPMVLLESMSSGVPCIAYETDCGVKDIIDDGENGFVISNRNEDHFVKELDELIDNRKKLKKFGESAKLKSDKFSPSEVFKIWDKILNKKEQKRKKNVSVFFKDLFSSRKLNSALFNILSIFYLVIIDVFNRSLILNEISIELFDASEAMVFNIFWISIILIIFNITKGWIKKIFVLFTTIVLFIFSVANYFIFCYFGNAFSWKDIVLSGEGFSFISSIFKYINSSIIIFIVLCLIFIISIFLLSKFNNNYKLKSLSTIVIILTICLTFTNYQEKYNDLSRIVDGWDSNEAVNSNSNYYSTWINPNKLITIGGTYDYIIRDFYESFLKKENLKESKHYVDDKLKEITLKDNNKLNYTGIFKNKNLIFVMMESMDDWMINESVTPTITYMMKHGFNFTNHYSPVYVTGSTANTEFIANTGIYPNINKLSPNYAYVDNNYKYSLANLFKEDGYIVNSFHRSYAHIYNREAMHLSFGYNKYHNFEDMGISNSNLDLDTHIIIDGYNKIVNSKKFMSFIITYSGHTPYTYDKIECQNNLKAIKKLKLNTSDEEEICGYSTARETDNMFKLLIDNLKKDGMLDDTVIIAFTDHPNYVKYSDSENNKLNKTIFFIYSNEMKKNEISDLSSTINILPTIKNLFDLDGKFYYPGCDLLNCKDNYVLFNDFTYYNGQDIVPFKAKQYDDVAFSKHLLISNYYK